MINHKKLAAFLLIVITVAVAGCSGNSGADGQMNTAANMPMEPIKVELSWTPQQVSVNQMVTFEAVVTQAGEPVDDAKEVVFEIINKKDKSRKYEFTGESSGNGKYKADGTIEEEGEFTVTSHVTARTQHSMPSRELLVQP
ncbi:FixH family protein [Paenibacillus sp. BAC0078]